MRKAILNIDVSSAGGKQLKAYDNARPCRTRKRASATRKQRRLEERKARKAKKNDGQNDQ
jgi:hypothetical protein